MSNLTRNNYNPDILETIANLSNDEVFTPPKLANQILDLLPEEVWSNPNLTFLDPAVKTGIFLREIASRLIDGLADQIPDLQERVNHILTKQVFGIGITELTTLMARRTVYCSMTANGPFSIVTEFDNEKGNIIFPDTKHTWNDKGRCEYCGANESNYSGGANRESYAYPFIHDNFEREFGNMKFDVIIGNPPYQLSDGLEGGNSARASAIYDLFIDKAAELKPKYITMIIPSRWMRGSAEGISDKWAQSMINNNSIKIMHDFENADSLFNDVGIAGGVNYFLWDFDYNGKCKYYYHYEDGRTESRLDSLNSFNSGIVIREKESHDILKKVMKIEKDFFNHDSKNFSSYVSPKHYFDRGGLLTSNWRDYKTEKNEEYHIKYYTSKSTNGVSFGWIKDEQIPKNKKAVPLHKVYIPAAHGGQSQVLGVPRYGEPNSVCSQTYLVIGYDSINHNLTKEKCENIITYIQSKFFRFMVKIKKKTQNGPRGVYQFVPLQDFSKPWTDEELCKKYKLTQEEIDYIEDNIAPMGE
ncbi:MAG TPA: restriction endonuclease [Clostridiales bacterium]|nr:restriction endonuclease [Clostridiales bacterium]